MARYKKKPVVIEAFQWTAGPDQLEDPEWIVEALKKPVTEVGAASVIIDGDSGNPIMRIRTLEGPITAQVGDYIIRGVKGELYPCKPDIFEATYEPA